MAGLAPAIHALATKRTRDQGVDARRKAGLTWGDRYGVNWKIL
jgi:hypothetical protein